MSLPAYLSVGFYFDKKRALATGIASSGTGVGTLILAPVTAQLLELMDWKNTVVMIGGLFLHTVLCGAVMRPMYFSPKSRESCANLADESSSDPVHAKLLNESKMPAQGKVILELKNLDRKASSDIHDVDDVNIIRSLPTIMPTRLLKSESHDLKTLKRKATSGEIHPGNLYWESLLNVNVFSSYRSLQHLKSQESASKNHDGEVVVDSKKPNCCDILRLNIYRVMPLLSNKIFLVICIANILIHAVYYIPFVYITEQCKSLGIDSTRTASLIAIMGKIYHFILLCSTLTTSHIERNISVVLLK